MFFKSMAGSQDIIKSQKILPGGLKLLSYPAPLKIRADEDRVLFGDAFSLKGNVVVVQTHSDDALIHAGNTAALIAERAHNARLVTVVSDEAGVTDLYAGQYYRKHLYYKDYSKSMPLDMVKRIIRYREAKHSAQEMGFENHTSFDFSWPAIKPVYENGRLISNLTEYKRPTKGEFARICDFVDRAAADVYLLAAPGCRHQQHRQATDLFLQAIRRYSSHSRLLFWSDDIDKAVLNIQDNIIVYYSSEQEEENKRRIYRSSESQNMRRGGSGNYYGDMAEGISKYIYHKSTSNDEQGFYKQYGHAEGFFANRFE